MKSFALPLCLALAVRAHAQLSVSADGSVRGKFYVSVDDSAVLFVNGATVFTAQAGESESPEVTLKPGDRVVARLTNIGGPRRFMLTFAGSDLRTLVSFPARAFRILPDATTDDVAPGDFAALKKMAVPDRTQRAQRLPIRSQSEWVWGDAEVCSLAVLTTREMFRPVLSGALGETAKLDTSPPVLTIEASVDGPSMLHITKDHLYWMNGGNAKPGFLTAPTYVNGETWPVKWGRPQEGRGVDRSDNRAIVLTTLDLKGEMVSNSEERGVDRIDRSRTPVDIKRRGDEIVVSIPDPEAGSRWYKIVFREKKR